MSRVEAFGRLRAICNEHALDNTCCQHLALLLDVAHRLILAHKANLGKIFSDDELVLLKQMLTSNPQGVAVLMRTVDIIPGFTTMKHPGGNRRYDHLRASLIYSHR